MELEPPNLNLPVERPNHFGWLLVGACMLVGVASAFFSPGFALVFSACAIVASPLLPWILFPSRFRYPGRGHGGRITATVLMFAYLALAKWLLLPWVIGLLESVLPQFAAS